jgi:putative nucleotidyltransferase with HDIG domain
MLVPGTEITFTLFVNDRLAITPLIEASEASPVRLRDTFADVTCDIVISKTDIPQYIRYLDLIMGRQAEQGRAGALTKALAVREYSKIVLKELLDDPRSGEGIKKAGRLVQSLMDCVLGDRETLYDMLCLRSYDTYTYTHSVNVAVLSLRLGISAGLPKDDLEMLGLGAMLHDIGKSAVPHEVLTKQGRLTKVEYALVRSHVIEGEKILRAHPDVPEPSLSAAVQHHEKLSGRGYPHRLCGREITLFGRITAIADCYDALTTRRPYKDALSPFKALSIVVSEPADYDTRLLHTFIRMLGKER